ncbi:PQQ-dependent sugar dehydrogenase [Sphingomonas panacisoli]|uniref:PQQ-dependent sugar dehydrogenase n=1 Tax=Sphingomonas panacisoli TaxID=1813879 RepID=A0A5B8LGE5_9SPHN|nr:PQQ-dependent sugar dehydrogenase [Sphingomonas panacisoli]QDZ06190.1 PQQ-dependent sugar dehydrogenase [Sphingomonas panacisoli]
MLRFALLGLLVATACSAAPQDSAKPSTKVPRNSPLEPDIKNVPATTGRANLAPTQPPFTITNIGRFDEPFAMAFMPDGRLLVTEKAGQLKLRAADGTVVAITGAPPVAKAGQGGLLDVAIAPDFATSKTIYLSYAEPGADGSALALMRATLDEPTHALTKTAVIWRSGMNGPGGQFGANILFSPDGKYLFLSSGERQRFTPAQDPNQALGKILRLTLDGKAAPGNPSFDKGGVEAMTWTTGHRNPYGMIFTPDGRLWEEEMGPRGGDELNLILPAKNYGWPIVSNGDNYSGQIIPDHPSKPEFEAPKLWWNPSISPGGMIYYSGAMFPELKGSLLICAMSDAGLAHITLNGDTATPAHFWDFGTRLRDIAQAPDGSIWLLEDGGQGAQGRLMRLTPRT